MCIVRIDDDHHRHTAEWHEVGSGEAAAAQCVDTHPKAWSIVVVAATSAAAAATTAAAAAAATAAAAIAAAAFPTVTPD